MSAMAQTLNALLDRTASEKGGRPALVHARRDEERATTFAQLRGLVLQAAAGFRARGVGPGDAVAIIHRNDPAFVVAYFALARLGAVAVPINFMVQKPEELRFMLEHSGVRGVVTQVEFLKGVRKAAAGLPAGAATWISDREEGSESLAGEEHFWEFVRAQAEPAPEVFSEVSPDDTVSVLYTSGTTGQPKGAMLTHRNIVSNCEASLQALTLTDKEVVLTILPMFHTFAWTACVIVSIRLGLKNVIVSSITPAKPWLTQMARHGVTLFAAVPQIHALLAKQATGWQGLVLRYWFFRRVRLAISGSAPLTAATHEEFRKAFGLGIIEGYGLTETSPVATINPVLAPRHGSVGKPIPGVEIQIRGDDGRPVPAGQEGEICIKGPNIMKGYLKNEAATREAVDSDGWFRTGDIGALEDGYLFIRDRIKDMIIVKGLKVFSAQVEASLMEHPDIQEAAVIGVPDESGDETVKAFVVLKEGATARKADLQAFARKKLDGYKRPRDIEILKELPKNALQKTLKRVLRQREIERLGPKP